MATIFIAHRAGRSARQARDHELLHRLARVELGGRGREAPGRARWSLVQRLSARNEMEVALKTSSDPYDFAPVAYLTLDREGTIVDANLTSPKLLGVERSRLIKRQLNLFISPGDLPGFINLLTAVFAGKVKSTIKAVVMSENMYDPKE